MEDPRQEAAQRAAAGGSFSPVETTAGSGDWREDPREFRLAVELADVLSSRDCEVLLGYIDSYGQVQGGVAHEDGAGPHLDPEIRRARQTVIPRNADTAWVYEQLGGALASCNRDCFGFDLRDFDQDLSIVDYREGDFYDWHLDVGREAPSRKLSASVVLSSPEDYEGGALTFPGARFDRVAQGSAVVFPSFLLHGVQPVTRGRRCALLAWVGGPRFR